MVDACSMPVPVSLRNYLRLAVEDSVETKGECYNNICSYRTTLVGSVSPDFNDPVLPPSDHFTLFRVHQNPQTTPVVAFQLGAYHFAALRLPARDATFLVCPVNGFFALPRETGLDPIILVLVAGRESILGERRSEGHVKEVVGCRLSRERRMGRREGQEGQEDE